MINMIKGIRFAGIETGMKVKGLDVGLVVSDEDMNCLAVYTKNAVKAAHILYNRRLKGNSIRAILVNSGCANACTGEEGVEDLGNIARGLSETLGIERQSIVFASTGVIGKRLPSDRIVASIPMLLKGLDENNIDVFARAIMTTDTYPKVINTGFEGKRRYSVIGIAKGSGMINPLFATMLVFIFTDFPVPIERFRRHFGTAVKGSFERITVDGECSTNDTVMLFSKKSGSDEDSLGLFKENLNKVMKELSLMVVRDGEGATKVVHILVKGARTRQDAEKIARRIATSPLSKTAFFGCDPNWGRFMAAAGDAGVAINQSRVEIVLQDEVIVRDGIEVPFDEIRLKELMNRKEIELVIDLHHGRSFFDIYTTDLTYDYIKINASYRS